MGLCRNPSERTPRHRLLPSLCPRALHNSSLPCRSVTPWLARFAQPSWDLMLIACASLKLHGPQLHTGATCEPREHTTAHKKNLPAVPRRRCSCLCWCVPVPSVTGRGNDTISNIMTWGWGRWQKIKLLGDGGCFSSRTETEQRGDGQYATERLRVRVARSKRRNTVCGSTRAPSRKVRAWCIHGIHLVPPFQIKGGGGVTAFRGRSEWACRATTRLDVVAG